MDNRSILLATALALFAERGYDAVGVQEVAEASGVTKPTLYHYFGSKQGLLQALIEQHHAPIEKDILSAADYQHDLSQTLENLARAFFACARRDPVYYRLQLSLNLAAPESEAHRLIAAHSAALLASIESLFATAAYDHGNMRGRQKIYATGFTGLVNACISLWLNGSIELDEALTRDAVRQFQYGIYS